MIRSVQMDQLRKLDSELRALGVAKEPSLDTHVMIALMSGEVPKLKPAAKVSEVARSKIIGATYRDERKLKFSDVFASTNGYEADMTRFNAYAKQRERALAEYSRQSEKIMLRAMKKDADPEEISDALHEAAERSGLKALKAPNFDALQSTD